MNYFLLLIILCMGGAGYYEYTTLQQQAANSDTSIKDLETKNKALQDDKDQLTKTVANDEAKITELNKAAAEQPAPSAAASPAPAPHEPSVSPGPSTILGTIKTTDGNTYEDCHLLKVQPASIVVKDSAGVTQISYKVMQIDLQMHFGYDPMKGANLTAAQVQDLERQRVSGN